MTHFRRQCRDFDISVHLIEPGFHKTNITDTRNLEKQLLHSWKQAPADVKDDYGEEFLKQGEE